MVSYSSNPPVPNTCTSASILAFFVISFKMYFVGTLFQYAVNFNTTELSDAGYLATQMILQSYKTINSIRGSILDGIYFFSTFLIFQSLIDSSNGLECTYSSFLYHGYLSVHVQFRFLE